jgi:hypothetical protein
MAADNDGTAKAPTHNSAGRTPIKPLAPKTLHFAAKAQHIALFHRRPC